MVRSRTGPQIHFRITDHSATEDILQGSIRFGRVDDTVIDVHLCLLEHQQPFIKISPFDQIVSSGTESFFELQAVHIPVCLPGHTDGNLCRIDRSPFRNVQCGHHILSFQCLPGIGLQRRCCFLLDLLPSQAVFQVSIFQNGFSPETGVLSLWISCWSYSFLSGILHSAHNLSDFFPGSVPR